MVVAILALEHSTTSKIASILNQMGISYHIMTVSDKPEHVYSHIIIGGGSKSTVETLPSWIINGKEPVLGIGYGMQLVAKTFGGKITSICKQEKGCAYITEHIEGKFSYSQRWMNRCDVVTALPSQFMVTAITDDDVPVAFTDGKKWWCYQYHPECPDFGNVQIFKNFLDRKCQLEPSPK